MSLIQDYTNVIFTFEYSKECTGQDGLVTFDNSYYN